MKSRPGWCAWRPWAERGRSGALIRLVLIFWLAVAGAALPVATQAQTPAPNADASQAAAQSTAPPPVPPSVVPPSIEALSAELDTADDQLHAVSKDLRDRSLDEGAFHKAIAAIPPVKTQLNDALSELSPRLESIDARLAELGPAPAAGAPAEPSDIAHNRATLSRFRGIVDADIKRSRFLLVEADQLSTALSERARMLFSARLWMRSASVLSPALWEGFFTALPGDLAKLGALFGDERRQLAATSRGALSAPLWIVGAVLAILILIPFRLILSAFGYRVAAHSMPNTRLRRSALAVWIVLVCALTPLLSGLVLRTAVGGVGGLTPAFSRLVAGLIRALFVGAGVEALGRATLSPDRPSWRLAPIPDAVVAKLAPFPGLIGLSSALAYAVAAANAAAGSSASTTAAGDCVTVLLELAALAVTLISLGRARDERLAAAAEHPEEERPQGALPWVVVAILAWLSLAASFVAVLTGYLALASFIMRETIWIGMILAVLFLLIRFVDDLFPTLLSPDRYIGRSIRIAIGFSPEMLEQIGVLLSGVVRLLLLFGGWSAILLPFGASAGDAFGRLTSADLVIHLGQVSVSPAAILSALAVFVGGIAATRAVRGWLETKYLPKTSMDLGVRSSVAAAVTYGGALIALVATCAYLGLSLDKIALFASALSVGIGFGLQSVIGNFVSGLILLLERPVKVGDWIAIGGQEGDVRRVSVRATEIEMGDRSRLIVPNSDLISKTVRNVTAGDAMGQVKIVLLLDGGADPQMVRQTLLGEIGAHAEVLPQPAPSVYISDVKEGALEFTAFAFVASPRRSFAVKSDLLFEIIPALAEKGVALASSTPVVNVTTSAPPPAASPPPSPKV